MPPSKTLLDYYHDCRTGKRRSGKGGGCGRATPAAQTQGRLFVASGSPRMVDDHASSGTRAWARPGMYREWGAFRPRSWSGPSPTRRWTSLPGPFCKRATGKGGSLRAQTCKKCARRNASPSRQTAAPVSLVESSGCSADAGRKIFPDEDDSAGFFRNNAVIFRGPVFRIRAIRGNCVAGGGVSPGACDKIHHDPSGSGLYLPGRSW